jgi:hypothetical protein
VASAEVWAGRIADRLLAGQPVLKAAGGELRRRQLETQLRPACEALAELEAEFERSKVRLAGLMRENWLPDGQVIGPLTAGRFQRFDVAEWESALTRKETR